MSNAKMVLLVAAMIGGVAAGIHYGGKSFFHEMAGGDCGPLGCAPPQKKSSAWNKAETTPEQDEWIRRANAPQTGRGHEPTDADLGYASKGEE